MIKDWIRRTISMCSRGKERPESITLPGHLYHALWRELEDIYLGMTKDKGIVFYTQDYFIFEGVYIRLGKDLSISVFVPELQEP